MDAFGQQTLNSVKFDQLAIWGTFISEAQHSKDNILKAIPEAAKFLNPLQKVAILSIIRPDQLSQLLLNACDELYATEVLQNPIE